MLQCLCLGISCGFTTARLFPFGKLSKLKSAAQTYLKKYTVPTFREIEAFIEFSFISYLERSLIAMMMRMTHSSKKRIYQNPWWLPEYMLLTPTKYNNLMPLALS